LFSEKCFETVLRLEREEEMGSGVDGREGEWRGEGHVQSLARPEEIQRTSWVVLWKWVVPYIVYLHCGVTTPTALRWDSMLDAVAKEGKHE